MVRRTYDPTNYGALTPICAGPSTKEKGIPLVVVWRILYRSSPWTLDRRQDSLSPPGRCDPGVHHPPPQTRARPLVQEARTVGGQVRRRVRPEGDGHE